MAFYPLNDSKTNLCRRRPNEGCHSVAKNAKLREKNPDSSRHFGYAEAVAAERKLQSLVFVGQWIQTCWASLLPEKLALLFKKCWRHGSESACSETYFCNDLPASRLQHKNVEWAVGACQLWHYIKALCAYLLGVEAEWDKPHFPVIDGQSKGQRQHNHLSSLFYGISFPL